MQPYARATVLLQFHRKGWVIELSYTACNGASTGPTIIPANGVATMTLRPLLDADLKLERDPILGEDTYELFETIGVPHS